MDDRHYHLESTALVKRNLLLLYHNNFWAKLQTFNNMIGIE